MGSEDNSSLGDPNVILQSGHKIALSDNQRSNNANRIYPLTDVDDGAASAANVGPGGLMSADEFSQEGEKTGKNAFGKSRIQITGQQQPNNADMKTIDNDFDS